MEVAICRCFSLPRQWVEAIGGCVLTGWTALCCIVGHPLKIPFLPGYIEVLAYDIEEIVSRFQALDVRIYRGRRHYTISNGIDTLRIWNLEYRYKRVREVRLGSITLYQPTDIDEIKEFIKKYGDGKRKVKIIDVYMEADLSFLGIK